MTTEKGNLSYSAECMLRYLSKDLYYTEEFEALQKEYPNFEYIPALSAPAEGDNWRFNIPD